MNKSDRKLDNAKEKVIGEIREATGKVTGNEQLELKGKIQSSKADLKMKVENVREDVAHAINHAIDKK